MEALGGDLRWGDRFLAEHAAVFYYWVLVAIYLISPSASYQFMEMVEVGAGLLRRLKLIGAAGQAVLLRC